jgi:hypothetical protein
MIWRTAYILCESVISDRINGNKKGWTCSTHGGDDEFMQNINRNVRGPLLFGEAEINDKIILKDEKV